MMKKKKNLYFLVNMLTRVRCQQMEYSRTESLHHCFCSDIFSALMALAMGLSDVWLQ